MKVGFYEAEVFISFKDLVLKTKPRSLIHTINLVLFFSTMNSGFHKQILSRYFVWAWFHHKYKCISSEYAT